MSRDNIVVEDDIETIRPILPKKRKSNPFNVSEILQRKRCNPIEILADIAMGNTYALGVEEPIRVIERRLAATELASYTVAKIKPKEMVDDDLELENIPVFVPKRGVHFTEEPEKVQSDFQQAQLAYDSGDDEDEDEDEYVEEDIVIEGDD